MKMYRVIKRNGLYSNDFTIVGTYKNRNRARNKAETIDMDYGAYIAFVECIEV